MSVTHSKSDRAVSGLFGKQIYSEGFLLHVASEVTRKEWWQMAERCGPPTCWKNRWPASLQDMLWVAEHMCPLGQGKSGTLYIAMDLENPQCQF